MKTRSKSSGACSFEVLGFPCNQFGHQEPGESAAEIMNGVKYVRPGEGFVPAFQLFEKGDVNGEKENPMFTYLKRHCPLPGGFIAAKASSIYWSPVRNDDIHWNFEKFLVDHTGRVRKRFLSSVSPFEIKGEIQQLLDDCESRQSSDDSFYDYDSK